MDQQKQMPVLRASDALTVMNAYRLDGKSYIDKQQAISNLANLYSEIKAPSERSPVCNPHLVNLTRHYYEQVEMKAKDMEGYKVIDPPEMAGKRYCSDIDFMLVHEGRKEASIVHVFNPALDDGQTIKEQGSEARTRIWINTMLAQKYSGYDIDEAVYIGIESDTLTESIANLPLDSETPATLYEEVTLKDAVNVYGEPSVVVLSGEYALGEGQKDPELEDFMKMANNYATTFVHEHIEADIRPAFDDFKINDPEYREEFDAQNEKMLIEFAQNTMLLKALNAEISSMQKQITQIPGIQDEAHAKMTDEEKAENKPLDKAKHIDGPAYKAHAKYKLHSAEEIAEVLSKHGVETTPEDITHNVVTESNVFDSKALTTKLKDSEFDMDTLKNLTASMQVRSTTKDFKATYKPILDKQVNEQIELIKQAYPTLKAFIDNEDGNDLETTNAEDLGYGETAMGM